MSAVSGAVSFSELKSSGAAHVRAGASAAGLYLPADYRLNLASNQTPANPIP